jgi:glucose/arabinose dehydrogenase
VLPRVSLARAFPRLTFRRPVFLTHAGDGSDRLFVVEQQGRVRVFENHQDVETARVFVDIRSQVNRNHNEEGLLALAFHPQHAANGHFYVYYSASRPRRGTLSRFTIETGDPSHADPASEHVILQVDQPWGNHNGGTVLFGPDGYLYLSLGDGGLANDPRGSGQDLSTLLGGILRIDVDHEENGRPYAIPADNPFVDRRGARGEIWAYGLRNVWRMSFDRATGDLWAGDVGQNAWEEINLIVRGGNYGWNIREGSHPFREGNSPDPLIDPVVEYPQRRGREVIGQSVTGGYVYRGERLRGLRGAYVYGDYVTGRIWALRYQGGRILDHREIFTPPPRLFISSFGEGPDGELFVCAFDRLDGRDGGTGRVYGLVEERD